MQADRHSVRQQLEALGYADVPEDVIDEFVEELNNQPSNPALIGDYYQSSSTFGSTQHHSPAATMKTPRPQQQQAPISRKEVQRQLRQMGYSEGLSEDLLNDLVRELNESYQDAVSTSSLKPQAQQQQNQQQQQQQQSSSSISRRPQANQPAKRQPFPSKSSPSSLAAQQQRESIKITDEQENNRFADNNNKSSRNAGSEDDDTLPVTTKLSQVDLSGLRAKVQQQQAELERVESQLLLQQQRIRPSSTGPHYRSPFAAVDPLINSRRKKADPVSRYHQYKSTWTKDPFLQRLEDPIKAKRSVFGSVGYHHLMGGQRVPVVRR